jgi:hypothetical protein
VLIVSLFKEKESQQDYRGMLKGIANKMKTHSKGLIQNVSNLLPTSTYDPMFIYRGEERSRRVDHRNPIR